VSVVIPAYQAAATVGEAVASALEQTSPPHEVVVCDDGSTDDLDGALRPYRGSIVLVRKENGGGASALNRAAAAATGELVAVLDADDVYDRRRLEAIGELSAARPDLDLVTTDAWLERAGVVEGRYSDVNPFEVADQRAAILRACFPGGWPAIRRRRLLDAGGFDESFAIAYDWECWLRLIHAGARAGMVDEPLMNYRIHRSSLSADTVRSLRERIRLLQAAGRDGRLSPDERRVLRGSLARDRRRLAAEEIGASLAAPAPRATLLALAARRDAPARARLAAVRGAFRVNSGSAAS
jgi:glycosyltransferase involved in cell wall biosynthesis